MVTFVIITTLLIALAFIACRWGFNSQEKVDSPEWERRAHRTGSSIY